VPSIVRALEGARGKLRSEKWLKKPESEALSDYASAKPGERM